MIVALLFATPAHAQQQPPQPTPSQLANGITQAVITMAQTIDRQAAEIDELKKQLAGGGKDTPKPERPRTLPLPQQDPPQ